MAIQVGLDLLTAAPQIIEATAIEAANPRCREAIAIRLHSRRISTGLLSPPRRDFSHQARGDSHISLRPDEIVVIEVLTFLHSDQLTRHRMGKGPVTEIGVAAIICGDRIQPQLQCFRRAEPQPFAAMERYEDITAGIER